MTDPKANSKDDDPKVSLRKWNPLKLRYSIQERQAIKL